MKKLLLGLVFAGCLMANAQEKEEMPSITFGIKAGFNASTLSRNNMNYNHYEDYENDDKLKMGANAGFFANIPVSQKFSVQPELLFSQLGSKTAENIRYVIPDYTYHSNSEYRTTLNYLVLPVMVQYNILPQLYVEGGPEFGLLLGGRVKGEDLITIKRPGNYNTNVTSELYSDKLNTSLYNKFNFGLGIGAGYYITESFGVSARFSAGLTNVMKDNEMDYKVRNNSFQLGVVFRFNKNRL